MTVHANSHPSAKARYQQKRENDYDAQKVHLYNNVAYPRRPSSTCSSDGWLSWFLWRASAKLEQLVVGPCPASRRAAVQIEGVEEACHHGALRHAVAPRGLRIQPGARVQVTCAAPMLPSPGSSSCIKPRKLEPPLPALSGGQALPGEERPAPHISMDNPRRSALLC
jgi:hypothetical protein